MKIEPTSVILSALKRAEDGDGIILRFYETKGEKADAEITLFKAPTEVTVVNMLEEEDAELAKAVKQEGKAITLTVNPFEIVTLRVKF